MAAAENVMCISSHVDLDPESESDSDSKMEDEPPAMKLFGLGSSSCGLKIQYESNRCGFDLQNISSIGRHTIRIGGESQVFLKTKPILGQICRRWSS